MTLLVKNELVFYMLAFHASMNLVNSYGLSEVGTDAVELFRRLPDNMITEKMDVRVLSVCSHSGLIDEARSIFTRIPTKSEWNNTAMVLMAASMSSSRSSQFFVLSRSLFFAETQKSIEEFKGHHPPRLPIHREFDEIWLDRI